MTNSAKPAKHGRDHCPGGADPIPCLGGTFPWAIITDGYVGTNSGTLYSVGGQYYGTNDTTQDYYTFTARSATYPVFGLTNYYTVNVVQRGIYLIDAQLTIESWSTVTDGRAEFRLEPNREAWYPFGFGTNENDAWIDSHTTHDVNGQVGSWFRVNGIASLEASTEFLPKFKQITGVNDLVAAVNYLKVVRLKDYEDLADLVTGSVA